MILRFSRGLVIGSALLAVIVGLWPLAQRPGVLLALAAVFCGGAGLAYRHLGAASAIVFSSAYISYGLVRWIAGPDIAAMPFFLAAFSGVAIGASARNGWAAPPRWRTPLVWWASWVALAWPFVTLRALGGSFAPNEAIGSIVTAALLQLSLALWMDRLLAEESARGPLTEVAPVTWQAPLVASAALTAAAAIYQRGWNLQWMSGEPWVGLGRAVGLMGDANPMGLATAFWAPVTLASTPRTRGGLLAGVALAACLWTGAWMSGSRATLILMAFGVASLLALAATAWGWSRRVIVAALAVAMLVAAAALPLAGRYASAASPAGRLIAALPLSSPGAAAYELLWRRDGYGLAAVQAIREHPFVGVGIGRFTPLSTAYHQRVTGRAIPPDNAQNLWRHTLSEQGLVGLVPLLWLTALTLGRIFAAPAAGADLVRRAMVLAFGASLLVGYPLQDPAIAVTLATLVASVGRERAPA